MRILQAVFLASLAMVGCASQPNLVGPSPVSARTASVVVPSYPLMRDDGIYLCTVTLEGRTSCGRVIRPEPRPPVDR